MRACKTRIAVSLILVAMIVPFQSNAKQIQKLGDSGYFHVHGISIQAINLAAKEITIEVSFGANVNGPFNMTWWPPGVGWRIARGAQKNNSIRHEYEQWQLEWKRVTIYSDTWINMFPYEVYQTEIVFGLSAVDIEYYSSGCWLSVELEREGHWEVDGNLQETSAGKTQEINDSYSRRKIEELGLKSFLSLIIQLRHPPGFSSKMLIPTWGPIVFILTTLMLQLILGRRIGRGEHVSIFTAITVFALGTTFSIREMTPPELTCAELANFILSLVYMLALFVTIYAGRHAKARSGPD